MHGQPWKHLFQFLTLWPLYQVQADVWKGTWGDVLLLSAPACGSQATHAACFTESTKMAA